MTRVPEFRAWLKEEKEMIVVEDMVWSCQNNGELYFLGIGDSITFWRDADEIEIMQSTGLKDENGTEVYEGDIVEYKDGENSFTGVVMYSVFGWFVEGNDDKYSFEDFSDEQTMTSDVEIIGNIYENKELLE